MNASQRAAHVAALETELRSLEQRPHPDMRRITEVCRELEKYSDNPAKPAIETATPATRAQRGRPRTRKTPGE